MKKLLILVGLSLGVLAACNSPVETGTNQDATNNTPAKQGKIMLELSYGNATDGVVNLEIAETKQDIITGGKDIFAKVLRSKGTKKADGTIVPDVNIIEQELTQYAGKAFAVAVYNKNSDGTINTSAEGFAATIDYLPALQSYDQYLNCDVYFYTYVNPLIFCSLK